MYQELEKLNLRNPAQDEDIFTFENETNGKLPTDYVEFLKISNGGEGFIGENYIILWGVDELVSMNRSYEVQINSPGLLVFGSDGGGEAYGFDMRNPQWLIVKVPFIAMIWKDARPISDSFRGFLELLYLTT
jgi:hypothetical protein